MNEKIYKCRLCGRLSQFKGLHDLDCSKPWEENIEEFYLTKSMPTEPKHGLTDEEILNLGDIFSHSGVDMTKHITIWFTKNKLRLDHPED